MPTASVIAANCATKRGGTLCTLVPDPVHLNKLLAKCVKEVFLKPCQALMAVLNIGERDAKYRLSAKRKFTAIEIAALLRDEAGIHFLVRLMGDADPRWWQNVRRACLLGTVVERRAADLKLIRKAAHAHKNSSQEISAAFRAQDPDFYGIVLAGYDEAVAAAVFDRPLAPTKGRRL